MNDAIELALFIKKQRLRPEQVQDFYPTPSTVSTVMYYTGLNPVNMKPVYVCKNPHEKAMQRALIQYRNPANRELVLEALQKAGRMDLVGYDKKCLIRPDRNTAEGFKRNNTTGTKKNGKQSSSNVAKIKNTNESTTRKKKTIRNVHKKK